jgi:hypothetical protein
MKVFGKILSGRDGVNIQVEDATVSGLQMVQSGFFFRFTEGYFINIFVAIGVSSRLEPAIQFRVMNQQHELPRRIDNPGGAGDVARQVVAEKASWMLK